MGAAQRVPVALRTRPPPRPGGLEAPTAAAPARVQWDPERDLHLRPLPYRSLQLGLAGEAARRYADEWTVSITDVTPLAREVHALVRAGNLDAAAERLPEERPYPAADDLLSHLRAA